MSEYLTMAGKLCCGSIAFTALFGIGVVVALKWLKSPLGHGG